jgi:hypothetical protein
VKEEMPTIKIRLLSLFGFMLFLLTLIGGCSKEVNSEKIPKGFSVESYNDFTKMYSEYQKAKENNKPITEPLAKLFEYRKKEDKGELSQQESKVRDTLSSLLVTYNVVAKGSGASSAGSEWVIDATLKDKDKIPEWERTIEEALQLKKTNKPEANSSKSNEPKQEESVKQDKYQGEPKKETGVQAQETANKVQKYVVNMVNDLTIVENMSSDLQSSFSNSQIYGSGNSQTGENGPKIYSPNYNKQFENSMV